MSAGVATIEAMPDPAAREAEFVERKGLGHPDTTCDAIAEEVSRALSAAYLGRFGRILHHNVDKVLLVAGSSAPRFGGGRILEPIRVVLAGRATARIGDEAIDVPGIALEAARACIRARFRFLDPLRDMAFECRIREGSADLRALFARGHRVPLANDSSAGAGFAPFSPLERLVAGCERALNAPGTRPHPGCGEDVKVCATRVGAATRLAIACAGVAPLLDGPASYRDAMDATARVARDLAAGEAALSLDEVRVNAADEPRDGSFYLTVTGTSAEAGDDGATGRGNRASGLVAPGRPACMEAAAGKNPASHTGKLYALAAQELAEEIATQVGGVAAAECLLASRIGAPIDAPALFHLRVALRDGAVLGDVARMIGERAEAARTRLPGLWRRIVAGEARLF